MKNFDLSVPVTPLLRLEEGIYAKLETSNRTGSIKDRFVFEAVRRAIQNGDLRDESVLVEATSGNTGISLAAAGAAVGLHVKIVMPCNMSEERKRMMRLFGAEVIEVGPSDFAAAIDLRNKMVWELPHHWSPMQFENQLNVRIHSLFTGPEIAHQMIGSTKWDFVTGAGTGGTLMGVRKFLRYSAKKLGTEHRVVQVVPDEDAASHGIQGINDGQNFLLDPALMDDQIRIRTQDAIQTARELASTHGLLVGISAGANVCAARLHRARNPDRDVVTLLCDRGERYLSIL
jgi:cysteine synthase A